MPARTIPAHGGRLRVSFCRTGERTQTIVVDDGQQAWEQAVRFIARRDELRAGDQLFVHPEP